jgi:hypothetical protein
MRCAIGGTGEGRQRIDFFAPRRITLLRMRVNGPPAWIDTPATMTRTGHYTADIGALEPGCPPDFGYGGTYPVEHGGCGTVSGTLHLGFRLLANPRARGHQQLEFLGRFTSPLGATMFSVCIPSPPGPVADGRLLPATFSLTDHLAHRFLSTAEPARIHWFRGNPEGSTVTIIRAELDHLDPSAPCVRHSCGF